MSNVQVSGKRVAVDRRRPRGTRVRRHPGAQRRRAGRVRPLRAHRRTAHLRYSALQAREGSAWRSAARSWRAWASSFRLGVEIGTDLTFEQLLARVRRGVPRHGHLPRGARRLRRRGPAGRARGAAVSDRQHPSRARAAGCGRGSGEPARASASWCSAAAIPPWTATAPLSARAPSRSPAPTGATRPTCPARGATTRTAAKRASSSSSTASRSRSWVPSAWRA